MHSYYDVSSIYLLLQLNNLQNTFLYEEVLFEPFLVEKPETRDESKDLDAASKKHMAENLFDYIS